MRLRFTAHARRRRHERRVSRADVERVISEPETRTQTDLFTWRYVGRVEGRRITCVVAFDTEPPTVVTVIARRRPRR